MNKLRNCFILKFLVVSLAAFFSASISIGFAQEKSLDEDRDRGKTMLRKIKDQLKRDYYDPKFRGMDVDARFKEAEAKIDEARSLGQILGRSCSRSRCCLAVCSVVALHKKSFDVAIAASPPDMRRGSAPPSGY